MKVPHLWNDGEKIIIVIDIYNVPVPEKYSNIYDNQKSIYI